MAAILKTHLVITQRESNGNWRATTVRIRQGATGIKGDIGNSFASKDAALQGAYDSIKSNFATLNAYPDSSGYVQEQAVLKVINVPSSELAKTATEARTRIIAYSQDTDGTWRRTVVTAALDASPSVATGTGSDVFALRDGSMAREFGGVRVLQEVNVPNHLFYINT
jgi:hypothetical protein